MSPNLVLLHTDHIECPICHSEATAENFGEPGSGTKETVEKRISCRRCGAYSANNHFCFRAESEEEPLGPKNGPTRAKLSAWINDRHSRGEDLYFDHMFLDQTKPNDLRDAFFAVPDLDPLEKADRLLLSIKRETKHAGQKVTIDSKAVHWQAKAWAHNAKELHELIKILSDAGWVEVNFLSGWHAFIKIAPSGWARLRELSNLTISSEQGFVAMDFSEEFVTLYENGIAPAIWAAGYRPRRMDQVEHIDRIDDRIEVEIRNSKFIIADLTENNYGAIYEAGYARGAQVPTIFVRNREDLKNAHFDFNHINTLCWDSMEDLEAFVRSLSFRIINNCGKGTVTIPAERLEQYKKLYPTIFPDD